MIQQGDDKDASGSSRESEPLLAKGSYGSIQPGPSWASYSSRKKRGPWAAWLADVFIIPQRVVLAIFGFLAILNAYTMRICLSIAITEMVNKTGSIEQEEGVCPIDDDANPEDYTGGEFNWDQQMQGIILSSFYWGYVITHLPGGILASSCLWF